MKKEKFSLWALRHTASVLEAFRLWRFVRTRARHPKVCAEPVYFDLVFQGQKLSIPLRPGTSDSHIFLEIFLWKIYQFPAGFQAARIIDIGGNVGLAALYFSLLFPQATIDVFEPVPGNCEVILGAIRRNGLANIRVHPFALSNRNSKEQFFLPSPGDFACFSSKDSSSGVAFEVETRDTLSTLEELGLGNADLLKIDCEGAEVEVFESLSEKIGNIGLILGEIHPKLIHPADPYRLLSNLSRTHLVNIEKRFESDAFDFRASLKPWDGQAPQATSGQ